MRLNRLLLTLLLIFPLFSFSQSYTIKGTITDDNGKPLSNTKVAVPGTSNYTITNEEGEFILNGVPKGITNLEVTPEKESLPKIILETPEIADTTKDVELINYRADTENIPTISSDDEGAQTQASSGETVASILHSSRDAFINATSYNFSIARFRSRGYDDENLITVMNGVVMNDLSTGRGMYSTWSGLNDVVRNREITYGLASSYYSFGDVGGSVSIDSRASQQRKQLQVSFSLANRTYDNRFMISYGSGVNKDGWAYALSYSRRWAQEGYVKGTYYDGHSFFASLEKIIGRNHSLSLTAMGAPTENGRGKSSYEEMYDLAGNDHYYNPNWGYQNGAIRNSAVGKNSQPLIALTYHWDINPKSSFQAAAGYSFGYNRVSSLDWFNAINPQPDYYRNLPSFDANHGEDPESYLPYAAELTALLRDNEDSRQINWDGLYEANALHDTVYAGVRGRMAKYVVQEYVTNYNRYSMNAIYNAVVSDHMKLTLGGSFQKQESEYYREVTDLLGADYYVNLNQYVDVENPSETSVQQNDLNNPNRIIRVGDKYGYEYVAHIKKYSFWGQSNWNYDHFDFLLGLNITSTSMFRDGKVRNGVYPNDSYGKSMVHTYPEAGIKAGTTYKFNGRNYFFVNGLFETRAPYFDNLFLSPKTNNRTAQADNEFISSFEGGYRFKAPKVKFQLTGYFTQYTDETETYHFFDEQFHTFVNYTLTGVDKRHEGIEAALEVALGSGFSSYAVVSAGQHFYTSRPSARITQDSKDSVLAYNETIYLDNVRLSSGPQKAYSLGLNYRSPRFWFVNMSINAFDGIYYEASFTRRQAQSLDLVDPGSDKWNEILEQKQAPDAYSVDISGGWSWKIDNDFKSIKRPAYLVVNLGINNVTNNQDIVTRAAEPLRFDFEDKNVDKFAPRITYAYGVTYYINISLRMN